MSLLFVSFATFRIVYKLKKKGCFGKKFYTQNSVKVFFNQKFTFLKYLKNDYSNFKAVSFSFSQY